MTANSSALLGALVADAAALGLHWLYDVDRIASVTKDRDAAFFPLGPDAYKDAMGIFVHDARRSGDLSQYGETLALAMRSMVAQGGFDRTAYQKAYAAHFGAGGTYAGYIDRPTRGTLANLAADITDPSGIDDDQHPAIATLPAIIAGHSGSGTDLMASCRAAMHVTNVNAVADTYGMLFAQALADVIRGASLNTALTRAATGMEDLSAALSSTDTDSVSYGAVTERACHLTQGMPLSFHILATTGTFRDAIETNIRAGGDSCGRAIMIGALAGAAYGADTIPLEWILSMPEAAALWRSAQSLTHSTSSRNREHL